MTLDFNAIEPTVVPHFKGGVGEAHVRTAVSVADMAMAGITSRIPVDEVIDAMGEVGRRMPVEFRETALGGLAVTPTWQAITERIRKSK